MVSPDAAVLAMAPPLLFASVDGAVAAARGVPVRLLGYGFLALVGAATCEATQAVGALLLLGLLAAPAGTAQRLTSRPYLVLFFPSPVLRRPRCGPAWWSATPCRPFRRASPSSSPLPPAATPSRCSAPVASKALHHLGGIRAIVEGQPLTVTGRSGWGSVGSP